MRVFDGLLDLLFPPRCPFCGKLLGEEEAREACAKCMDELPICRGKEGDWSGEFVSQAVSVFRYQDQVRDSIRRLKFAGRRGYASCYGKWLARRVEERLGGEYDLISWVPLSKKRRRERDYDQAGLIAASMAEALGERAVSTLEKIRDTPAQSGLDDFDRRRANVLGAYRCVDPALVKDKRVLLVDDVLTSGSTVSECARVLRMAGAAGVVCAAVARAGRRV